MIQDTASYDSLAARPLPKWLTDQRDGLNTVQPVKLEMKEDRSLTISFAITGAIILIAVTIITILILRRQRRHPG